ncbi:MAG: TrmB family transcriptional regulator [Thermoplasmatales archaeon]|nr:TrmB family transcriptional regulator [Thermoplasmatales archaeon]
MSADNIFEGLSKFGLSPYEIKVLSTLLIEGEQTSTQVVRASGVPQPRIYDIFDSLKRKGFIEVSPGKKKIYRAVPLSVSSKRQIDELRDLSTRIDDFVELHKSRNRVPTPFVWLVEDDRQISSRIRKMIDSASTEVIFSANSDTFDLAFKHLKKAIARGVTVALVMFPDTPVQKLLELKGSVSRIRPSPASEVLIVDRNSALLNVGDDVSDRKYALYFDDSELIHISNYYFFHTIWVPSKQVTAFDLTKPVLLSTTWLACEAIDQIKKEGSNIYAVMKCIMDKREQTLSGIITGTKRILGMRHTFFIKVRDKIYSVGGRTARLEDARMIELRLNTKSTNITAKSD